MVWRAKRDALRQRRWIIEKRRDLAQRLAEQTGLRRAQTNLRTAMRIGLPVLARLRDAQLRRIARHQEGQLVPLHALEWMRCLLARDPANSVEPAAPLAAAGASRADSLARPTRPATPSGAAPAAVASPAAPSADRGRARASAAATPARRIH